MKILFYKANWKMWEYLLIVTGYIFGYDSPAYYGCKFNRDMAFFKYTMNKR